jgi:hypothetical protein
VPPGLPESSRHFSDEGPHIVSCWEERRGVGIQGRAFAGGGVCRGVMGVGLHGWVCRVCDEEGGGAFVESASLGVFPIENGEHIDAMTKCVLRSMLCLIFYVQVSNLPL